MASVAIPAIAGALGGGLYATIAATAVYVAGTVAVSYAASRALSPRVEDIDQNSFSSDFSQGATSVKSAGALVNARSGESAQEYVFGQVRKGGTITFMETTNDNQRLHLIVALAGHEVNAVSSIYVNDEIVNLDADGYVTGDKWRSKIRVLIHTGNQADASTNFANAPTNLASTLHAETSVGANFVGLGIAYLYLVLDYDADVFTTGLPTFTALVQGAKLFDPRTQTTEFSSNAALCIRHYIAAEFGLDDSAIDDTYFATAANDCDEEIALADGGTEKRYEINGTISAATAKGEILKAMNGACAGSLFQSSSGWKLKVGVYDSAIATFSLDDLRSSITVPTRKSRGNNFNKIVGTFKSAQDDYITTDYPGITSQTFLSEDNNVENQFDLALPLTTSSPMAQRLAKQALFKNREQIKFSADFSLRALLVEVGDVVALNIDEYGFENKEFEVTNWGLFVGDSGALRVSLDLRETSEAVYDWNAEETALQANNTTLPDATFVPEVGLSVGSELRLVNEQVVGALVIDVTSSALNASQFEVQYRISGSDTYISLGRSASNRFEVVGVEDALFDIRARAINGFGVAGEFKERLNEPVSIFADPPSGVSGLAANIVGETIHLTWTPVADLDLSHYRLRYSRAVADANYQNSVDLIKKIPRPANSITVPARSGTYFLKAIDKLGHASVNATAISVSTNLLESRDVETVFSVQEAPDFSGSKAQTVRSVSDFDTTLTLDGVTFFESLSGLFDSAPGGFDGGGGTGFASSGQYYFSEIVDLETRTTARIQSEIDVRLENQITFFDEAPGLFESRLGLFDGSDDNDAANVRLQVSHTDGDPLATPEPTWSEYADFVISDITARAMRFRVVLETDDATVTPAVSALGVVVDLPQRVESGSDIEVTGQATIEFSNAFTTLGDLLPSISIGAVLASGDRYVISNKTNEGFDVQIFTGDVLSTSPATIDFLAKGVGKSL